MMCDGKDAEFVADRIAELASKMWKTGIDRDSIVGWCNDLLQSLENRKKTPPEST